MPKYFFAICCALSLTGCIGRQAYYMSPLNGMHSPYRTVPMQSDSIRASAYLSGSIAFGEANEEEIDRKFSFTGAFFRSHNFGQFQARYGAGLTVGSYKVNPYASEGNDNTVDYTVINANARSYFFGSAGVDAAINIVTASKKSEWRILGLETSLSQEFGDYATFRQRLPVTAATLIAKENNFSTVGLFTEFLGRSGQSVMGMKMGYGKALGRYYNHLHTRSYEFNRDIFYRFTNFNYSTVAFHFTKNKWTGFIQVNSAPMSSSGMAGVNYRISKN